MNVCDEHGTNSNVCETAGCFRIGEESPVAQIFIRDKWNVECRNESGVVVAKAARAETGSSWFVGKLIDGVMTDCAEIHPWVPEHLGRHMVFAMLGAMIP